MSLFNQIIPNFTRSFTQREPANGGSSAALKPVHALNETPDAWNLVVQLPGVAREHLEFSTEENLISIRGSRNWQRPAGWTTLYRESVDAPYELVLEHGNNVDVEKIHAELKDGVLTVSLPKTEAVKPRKVVIN
jgi:HSP20 family molecular chaperone IbpA